VNKPPSAIAAWQAYTGTLNLPTHLHSVLLRDSYGQLLLLLLLLLLLVRSDSSALVI